MAFQVYDINTKACTSIGSTTCHTSCVTCTAANDNTKCTDCPENYTFMTD